MSASRDFATQSTPGIAAHPTLIQLSKLFKNERLSSGISNEVSGFVSARNIQKKNDLTDDARLWDILSNNDETYFNGPPWTDKEPKIASSQK